MKKNIVLKFATALILSVSMLKIDTLATGGWENSLAEMTTARRNLSSIAYNNKVYTFGGIEDRTISSKVEMYDIETDTWSSLPDMPIERHSHESVLYKDKVYILGGYNDIDGFLDRVDIFDLKSNTWSTGAYMPTAKGSFVAEVIDGKIYCVGGEIAGGNYSNTLEIYNIDSNSWMQEKGLLVARGDTDGVYKNGKIYIIGGYDGNNVLDTVEIYNVQTGTWSTLNSLNIARYSASVTIYRDEIYVLGGYNSSHLALNSVEKYNINSNTWEIMPSMADVKGGATAQSYYGKIYLIGGHDDVNNVSSVLSYTAKSIDANGKALDSVEKAEESWSDGDIIIARRFVERVNEEQLKDSLNIRLDFLENIFEKKNISSNVDIYIKSENMLSISLNTNSVNFEDFSGSEDVIKENAIGITINSSLPYSLNAYLPVEIQNSDKTNTMDKSILNIKENSETIYQTFINNTDKIVLKDNNTAGNDLVHGIDIKLKGGIAHEKDVYKTTIKFEVEQK